MPLLMGIRKYQKGFNMDSLILYLIKNPTWFTVSAFVSIILFGKLYYDKKNGKKKFNIIDMFLFFIMMFFLFVPVMLVWHKINEYNKIVQNKEYVLTKNNKILTITSKNEFLPSADLEIIYDDDKEIQVKLDDKLYTIDKTSEKIDKN